MFGACDQMNEHQLYSMNEEINSFLFDPGDGIPIDSASLGFQSGVGSSPKRMRREVARF